MFYHAQRWHRLPAEASAETRQRVLKCYGTTLSTVLVTPEFVHAAQLGDGDILRIERTGDVHAVFPAIQEQLGNATYSLCSQDAAQLWRTTLFQFQPDEALLLASDGLSNAFSDNAQFHAFARSLVQRVREYGAARVQAALPEWLERYSAQGSGDDISLILFVPKI